ncbi:28509_t:CDS:2 [Dentiscutata erythropus]|uniref:28509_t:CDS:1 n=1 Tax=Dentiscutata erythropus TaxID=1348616 RepID=A0A9N9GZE1_9GLOM|nr:28509_t:CDS:2 [Dentiscutata erythropus]
MSSEDSLYSRYKNAASISLPPTSQWALGVGNITAPYPLSFKAESSVMGHDKTKDKELFRKKFGLEEDKTQPSQDLLAYYRETSSNVIRSPSSPQPSILAQTTPVRRTRPPSSFGKTPLTNQKPTPGPSQLAGQTSSAGYAPLFTSSAHEEQEPQSPIIGNGYAALKRPSQVPLSQFDEKLNIKEDPSIATTFDPEKDRQLYETAVGFYRSFSKGSSQENESFFWEC